jgi:D-xylulose reductase
MSQFHFLNKVQPPQVTSLNLPPNTSCVLLKKQTISVEPTPLPILQPDGVLVKVIATDRSFISLGALLMSYGYAAATCITT